MARPLRIEFAGALYHVTSRGDRWGDIYLGDEDRGLWLEVMGRVRERFNWVIHAYCAMTNHYHLLIEAPDGHLSKGMRQFDGVYTQRFNRAHDRVCDGRDDAGAEMAQDRLHIDCLRQA